MRSILGWRFRHCERRWARGREASGTMSTLGPLPTVATSRHSFDQSACRCDGLQLQRKQIAPRNAGIIHGTAGIPATQPGIVYQCRNASAGLGKASPLVRRSAAATEEMLENASAGPLRSWPTSNSAAERVAALK